MKKRILITILLLLLCSSIVYAVTYGPKITRIQTFPGEEIKANSDFAKESISDQNLIAEQKLKALEDAVAELRNSIDKLSTDSTNARTETNVQQSNIQNSINGLKSQLDDLRDLKNLREELPPLLEQPREIITPKILLNLSAVNIGLIVVLIALVLFVKRDHEASHKMTPHGHPELHEYIRQHIGKGININTIRHQLISHDWDPEEVDQAIREVKEN